MTAIDHTAPAPVPARRAVAGRLTAAQVTGIACGLLLAFLAVMAWRQRWVADDAFIDLRIVDNIHSGHGPVFNPGERVETYTSPLWVTLLWLFWSVLNFIRLEWIAVVLGALFTLAGFALAGRGAWLLWGSTGRRGIGLPLGLAIVAVLPPTWDYATCGLETGLVFAWLGASFWALCALHFRRGEHHARRLGPLRLSPRLAAILIGLGPLVRPDMAVFSAGFLLALLLLPELRGRGPRARLVLWALLIPFAYQVFRMGYFAALAPNTALAKEAGSADWGRGWNYFNDFVRPYYLYLPLIALFAFAALESRLSPRPDRRTLVIALAPVACAAVHCIFLIRVGGDFMHGRMLLPTLFGAVLPLAVVVPGAVHRRHVALAGAVVLWALVCLVGLRSPYWGKLTAAQFGDERTYYATLSHNAHPVTLEDYRKMPWAQTGALLRRTAETGRALVVQVPMFSVLRSVGPGKPAADVASPVVVGGRAIGILGFAAGPKVHIVDQLGLSDPLGSRTKIEAIKFFNGVDKPARVRAGHDKFLTNEWLVARFAPPGTERVGKALLYPPWIASAREALGCAKTTELLDAVTKPLTPGRFISNVGASFHLNSLRFSPNPARAVEQLCTPSERASAGR